MGEGVERQEVILKARREAPHQCMSLDLIENRLALICTWLSQTILVRWLYASNVRAGMKSNPAYSIETKKRSHVSSNIHLTPIGPKVRC